MTNTKNSIRAATKHIANGKTMMWGNREVSVVRFDSFHNRNGRIEAQYRVVGLTDGYIGMAFASELK